MNKVNDFFKDISEVKAYDKLKFFVAGQYLVEISEVVYTESREEIPMFIVKALVKSFINHSEDIEPSKIPRVGETIGHFIKLTPAAKESAKRTLKSFIVAMYGAEEVANWDNNTFQTTVMDDVVGANALKGTLCYVEAKCNESNFPNLSWTACPGEDIIQLFNN